MKRDLKPYYGYNVTHNHVGHSSRKILKAIPIRRRLNDHAQPISNSCFWLLWTAYSCTSDPLPDLRILLILSRVFCFSWGNKSMTVRVGDELWTSCVVWTKLERKRARFCSQACGTAIRCGGWCAAGNKACVWISTCLYLCEKPPNCMERCRFVTMIFQ